MSGLLSLGTIGFSPLIDSNNVSVTATAKDMESLTKIKLRRQIEVGPPSPEKRCHATQRLHACDTNPQI